MQKIKRLCMKKGIHIFIDNKVFSVHYILSKICSYV